MNNYLVNLFSIRPTPVSEYTDTACNLVCLNKDELISHARLLLGFTPFLSSNILKISDKGVLDELSVIGQLLLDIIISPDIHSRKTRKNILQLSIKESTFASLLPFLKDYKYSLLVDEKFLDNKYKVPVVALCRSACIIGAAYVVNHCFYVTHTF